MSTKTASIEERARLILNPPRTTNDLKELRSIVNLNAALKTNPAHSHIAATIAEIELVTNTINYLDNYLAEGELGAARGEGEELIANTDRLAAALNEEKALKSRRPAYALACKKAKRAEGKPEHAELKAAADALHQEILSRTATMKAEKEEAAWGLEAVALSTKISDNQKHLDDAVLLLRRLAELRAKRATWKSQLEELVIAYEKQAGINS